jgi:lysophospholipase L1-like esterase
MKTRFISSTHRTIELISLAALIIAVASCGDFKKTSVYSPPATGSVDFSVFVSLGNSLTAGFQSGALFESAQMYSYPRQIARQAGLPDASFQQPLFPDPGVGGRMKIVGFSGGSPIIGEDPANETMSPSNVALSRPFNNLGIPGAILYDLLDTTDFAAKATARQNPFFYSVLRSKLMGNSPVAQALALHPTFVSVWIGNNDVLGYATSGGTKGSDLTGKLPTDVATFGYLYTQTINALLNGATNAKLVVANIPDVAAIPFFTTVPSVVVNPATNEPVVANGQYVPLIVMRHDANGNLYAGLANPLTDLILLTALDSLEAGVGIPTQLGGTGRPLGDEFVLDSLEVATAESAIQGFNNVIATIQANNSSRIALFDAYSVFNSFAKDGYSDLTGVHLTKDYLTGGFFGLDGVHPTSQGYAYVANMFIQAINSKFGANIAKVSIATVPGSIVLEKTSGTKILWPIIHYSDLMPMLRLIQRSDLQ